MLFECLFSDIITITENTEDTNRNTSDLPQCPICMGNVLIFQFSQSVFEKNFHSQFFQYLKNIFKTTLILLFFNLLNFFN